MGKWEILGIVDKGVNSEVHIPLEYWGFHGKNVDAVWYLLEWIA